MHWKDSPPPTENGGAATAAELTRPGQLIGTILQSSGQNSGTLATVVNIAILVFAASGVFSELQQSMNRIWQVEPSPWSAVWGWVRARFLSMTVMLALGFLLLLSFFVSTIITVFARAILGNATWAGVMVEIALSLGIITVLLATMFKWLPDAKIRWEDVWLGAFTTAVLFVLGKWGLTLYFEYEAPASAYGVFGSLVAVVIWVYYAAQILYRGAEFTRVRAGSLGHPVVPNSHARSIA